MQVSVISSLYTRNDAISEVVRGTAHALISRLQADVRVFVSSHNVDDLDVRDISGSGDLLSDPFFKTSDAIIYHFGIYYKHFNTIFLKNMNACRIVRFHNITPVEFMQDRERPLIEASMRQMAVIDEADEVWTDSAYNRSTLINHGIEPAKITTIPLYSKPHYRRPRRSGKAKNPLHILYVGRFVKSKGVMDLIKAVAKIRSRQIAPFKLILAGNEAFSDPAYITRLQDEIAARSLGSHIEFIGSVSDSQLSQLYREASIFVMPSYHEGFCMPIVEAMASCCVPVAYAAGNIPDLMGELGKLAPIGDIDRFAELLAETISDLSPSVRPARFSNPRGGYLSLEAYDELLLERLEMFSYKKFADRVADRVGDLVAKSRVRMGDKEHDPS